MKKEYVTPVIITTSFVLDDIISASTSPALFKTSSVLIDGGESSTVEQAIQFDGWK